MAGSAGLVIRLDRVKKKHPAGAFIKKIYILKI